MRRLWHPRRGQRPFASQRLSLTCQLQAPDIARIDAVEDSRVLAKQNLALAIVVKQQKSQEQEAARMFTLMEASSNQLREDIVFLGNSIAQKKRG